MATERRASMGSVRIAVVVSLILGGVVAGGLTAAEPVGEATGVSPDRRAGVAAQTNGTVNETDTRRNGSLAGEISSFMQITAASSEGAIDSGMWRAELNDTENASERARMIASRIEYLKEWETEIEDETTTLQADRNNNTSVSYVARASRLAARIEAFRTIRPPRSRRRRTRAGPR